MNKLFGLQQILSGICDFTNMDEWDENWLSCTIESNECDTYVVDHEAWKRKTKLLIFRCEELLGIFSFTDKISPKKGLTQIEKCVSKVIYIVL